MVAWLSESCCSLKHTQLFALIGHSHILINTTINWNTLLFESLNTALNKQITYTHFKRLRTLKFKFPI